VLKNKQGEIRVDDAQEILKSLLKSYEGGYKVMIIWMADKLNTAAANKLKIIRRTYRENGFHSYFRKRRRSFKPFALDANTSFNGLRSQYRRSLSFKKKILIQNSSEKIAHQAQEISTKHCNYNPIANLFF
jgi:DNA polymerase-3 subunit delta'